jgi:hypothetical protein
MEKALMVASFTSAGRQKIHSLPHSSAAPPCNCMIYNGIADSSNPAQGLQFFVLTKVNADERERRL